MLLEYNVDTKDENMKERAIELRRRVAGRKLDEALGDGTLSTDGLVKLKEKNRDERKAHIEERMIILNAFQNERMSIARAEQQLKAEGQLKTLTRDVSRASRLSKAKYDVLTDLEARVKRMRIQLKDPRDPPVEAVIAQELQVNDKQQLEGKFGICGICSRKILASLLATHSAMCERRKHERSPPKISLESAATVSKPRAPPQTKAGGEQSEQDADEEQYGRMPVYDIEQTVLTSVATFPPQRPRHCKVVSKGATYIDWEWLPPVIDGGLAVTDYEIAYLARHELFDKARGKYKRWEEEASVLTTRFCYRQDAIAHTGFRLCGLRAGSEYTNFRIRCCNLRGWSEWADMLQEEEDPLQMMLKQQDRTAKGGQDGVFQLEVQGGGNKRGGGGGDDASLAQGSVAGGGGSTVQTTTNGGAETFAERQLRLRLSVGKNVSTLEPETPTPPLFVNCSRATSSCLYLDWSAPLYDGGVPIVDYIVHYTILERKTTVTARDVVFEHVLKFKVGSGDAQGATIRHIPPNTVVEKVFVTAVNEVGLVSPKGPLKQKTCQTTDSSRHGQLSRELAAAAATVGPYFDSDFYTGVRQRLNRLEHMRQLAEELSVTEVDAEEEDEEKEWAAVLELQAMRQREEEAEKERLAKLNLSDDEEEQDGEQALQGKTESFLFTMRQRRAHFKRKLFALDKLIRDLKTERMDIDAFRTKCTLEMRAKEKLLLSYKLEVERLRQYTGTTVTSTVLAGFSMQYKTEDYTKRIETAFETCLQEIANIKYQVITGENRRLKAKEELDAAEEAKKERTAKFLDFEHEYQRRRKVLGKFSGTEDDSAMLYARYFRLLLEHMAERKGQRRKIADTFMNVIQRYLKSAFEKWRYGEFQATSSSDTGRFTSKGGVMLAQAAEKRVELQQLLREAISSTAAIKQKIDMAGLSRDRQKRLAASQDFKGMEEGMDHKDMYHVRGLKMLYEGDGYAKTNKFDLAKHLYEAQIMWIRSRPQIDIKLLAICHGRLGKMFLNLGKKNRAIVEFDRQLSLAREVEDKPEEADAYYGLGAGYLANCDYENAVRYLNIAQTLLNGLGSAAKYSGALRALRECYERMDRQDKMQICSERIHEIESELKDKIALANFKISDMKSRLVHTAAEIEHIVNIERTTFRAMNLKALIRSCEATLATLEAELAEQQDKCGAMAMLLAAIDQELQAAAECDEREMWSVLVHDQPQIVEVEELKVRLAARKTLELATLDGEQLLIKNLQVKIKNAENEIAGADEQLVLEEGSLMKHSRLDKPFRCIGLCAANAAGNEVTGTGTGGYEEFAAAEGQHIHMIDYHSGSVNHVYMGGSPELGHTGVVTCVLHDGKLIFSGSTDETIIAWDTSEQRKRVRTFVGHEGSIVSLAVEGLLLASGGSDSTLRLWDKHTGQQLRIVYGHSRSIMSIEIGPTWMLTGSTDTEVRVWKIGKSKRGSLAVDCVYRLIGHEAGVTCVRFGQMEVLSGDVKGRIFIWWMKTGQILRRCQVHDGPVKCMQFDSLHIVSGGADHSVCITDIATGEVMQTLRGHTLQISALAFDSERIISVSGDNTVRYWQWGQSTAPTDKVHVLDKGETLLSVAKRYSIKVDELMRWNGITDVRQCFAGMNLIVRKADPDAPTDAEKLLLQKEKRLEGGARLAEKISKDSAATDAMMEEGARLSKYNRVHKIATDIDFFSLGNRLFGEQKRQLELFPDQIDPNVNTRSLAGRFRADEERRKEEKRAEGKGMSDFEQAADNEEDAAALAWALKTGSKVRPRYFISTDNEDEWGEVANGLAIVMLQMLVEYEAYEVVMEQKRMLRSKQSVIGRINTRQLELELLQRKEEAEAAAAAAAEGTRPPPPAAAAGSEPLLLLGHGGAEIVVSDITPSTGSLTVQESPKPASFLPPLGVTQGAAHAGGLLEPIAEEGAGPGHVGDVGHEVPAPPLSRAEQARQRQEARAAEVARRKAAIKRAIAGSSTAEGASAGNDSDGSRPSSSRPRSRHSAGKQDAGKQETGSEEPLRLPPI